MRHHKNRILYTALLWIILGGTVPHLWAENFKLFISAHDAFSAGGRQFSGGTLAELDMDLGQAGIFLQPGALGRDIDIDAVHILDNGNIILSGLTPGRLAGDQVYHPGDLVEYDPLRDLSGLYLDHRILGKNVNIDALSINEKTGDLYLSFKAPGTMTGFTYDNGDIIRYNLRTHNADIYLPQSEFDGPVDIDALFIRENGNVVFSTDEPGSLQGITFGPDQLVEYDLQNKRAWITYDGADSPGADIDCLHIARDERIILPYHGSSGTDIKENNSGGYGAGGSMSVPFGYRQPNSTLPSPTGMNNTGGGTTYNNPPRYYPDPSTPQISEDPGQQPVPEPGTLALLGLGAGWFIRRRQKQLRTEKR